MNLSDRQSTLVNPKANAARIAAASASDTTNIPGAWERGPKAASEEI